MGWVRAAAYTYALSPRHRFRPGRRPPQEYPGPPHDQALLTALLRLPPPYRPALLLHDALGLSLADTAAETEASTAATAGRLLHAREEMARQLPHLRHTPPERRPAVLGARLRELAAAQPARTTPARTVREGSEDRTRRCTRAALGLTAAITAATVVTVVTGGGSVQGDRPDPAPPRPPGAVSPSPSPYPQAPLPGPGPGPGSVPDSGAGSGVDAGSYGSTGTALDEQYAHGPASPGDAYLPQLRSTNRRMHLDDIPQAEAAQPEAAQPEAAQPETAQPETAQPSPRQEGPR